MHERQSLNDKVRAHFRLVTSAAYKNGGL